jgi:hypothetical protein
VLCWRPTELMIVNANAMILLVWWLFEQFDPSKSCYICVYIYIHNMLSLYYYLPPMGWVVLW